MTRVRGWAGWAMRAPGGWPVHLVLAALLLPRAILLGEALFDRDLHMDWYPRALVFAQTIRGGSLPLWDLTIGFGQPLLADPSAQVVYPTTWLNLLLAPWTVYSVFALGHLAFTAVGFTLLARTVGLRQGEAVAAGAAWMLCGPVASLANLWHHFASAAWMPWVVLTAHQLARRPSPARIAGFAVCLGFQVLAGSGDMVLLTAALVGAWWLAAGPPWRRSLRAAAPVAAGILLAAAVSAAQWLPTVELAANSARRALPGASRTQWSVPPAGLVRFAVPLDASGQLAYTPAAHAALFDSYRHPFFASLYVGVVALALGSLGLVRRRVRRLALVLATVATLALLVSMGGHTPVYGLAVRLVPLAEHFRFPTKVTVLVGFAMAMLAGLGLGALRHRPRGRVLAASLALALAAVLTAGATLFGPGLPVATGRGLLLDRPGAAGDALPSLVRLLGHASLAGAAALAVFRARRGVAWPRALVGACLLADLLLAHHDLHSTVPAEFFRVPPPVLSALDLSDRGRTYVYEYEILSGTSERLLGRPAPYTVAQPAPGIDPRPLAAFGMRVYPVPSCAGYWGVEGSWDLDKRGLQPLPLVTLNLLLREVEATPAHSRLLRLGAVRNVVSLHEQGFDDLVPGPTFTSLFGEPIRTFQVPGALPRAYAVSRARIVAGESVAAALLDPSFDSAKEIILPGSPTRVEGVGPGAGVGRVEIQELFADRVRLVAVLAEPGYVVSVDAWDPGWQGTVDGRPTEVLPANGVFRAVAVPAGRHTVEMVYRPPSVLWGVATSVAAGLVLVALAAKARRRRRRGAR